MRESCLEYKNSNDIWVLKRAKQFVQKGVSEAKSQFDLLLGFDLVSGLVFGELCDWRWRLEYILMEFFMLYGIPKVIVWLGWKPKYKKRMEEICRDLGILELYVLPKMCVKRLEYLCRDFWDEMNGLRNMKWNTKEELVEEFQYQLNYMNRRSRGTRRPESAVMRRAREEQSIVYLGGDELKEVFLYRTIRRVGEDGCVHIAGMKYMIPPALRNRVRGKRVELGVDISCLESVVAYEEGTYRRIGRLWRVSVRLE